MEGVELWAVELNCKTHNFKKCSYKTKKNKEYDFDNETQGLNCHYKKYSKCFGKYTMQSSLS